MTLKDWEDKLKAKRMQTPWRQFLMEICSRAPVVYTRERWTISKFPKSDRIGGVTTSIHFADTDHMLTDDISSTGRSFFDTLFQIVQSAVFPGMRHLHAENADYSDIVINSQTAYLSNTVITGCENVVYSTSVKDDSRNVFESMMVWNNCESVFSSKSIINSYNIFYSQSIHNSANIWFSHNLVGCSECISCDHLENASYCISNKSLGKEEYIKQKKILLARKETFTDSYQRILSIPWDNLICTDTDGKSNIECQDISNSYYCYNVHHGRNLFLHGSTKWAESSFDCYTGWSPRVTNMYGVTSSWNCENIYCSAMIDEWSSNLYYCMYCGACSFCLGCIGLQNKSYCIFNKQYTKEEWYEKVDDIFSQIEKLPSCQRGVGGDLSSQLGDFFPASMCPFYFNDTAAYLIDSSFTKEEVTQAWYLRRDAPIKVDIPVGSRLVLTSELGKYEWRMIDGEFIPQTRHPERNEVESKDLISLSWDPSTAVGMTQTRWIDPEILNIIIQDESWNVYRIIKMEYDFLMKHGLPLPRQHWLERMKQNFKIVS